LPAAGGGELDVQAAVASMSAVAARSIKALPTGSPCSLAAPGGSSPAPPAADRGPYRGGPIVQALGS